MAHIEVKNQGKGILKEDLNHIFDMYYQSRKTQTRIGSGIGLAIAKKLVEVQNGTIAVESIENKFTIFTVEIPVEGMQLVHNFQSNGATKTSTIPAYKPTNHTNNECILVVEDEPDLLNYITEILSDYRVIKADNGSTALELAKKTYPPVNHF